MKLTRLAALVVVPAAFSLAACGGGSSGVLGNTIGTGGQQAQHPVRERLARSRQQHRHLLASDRRRARRPRPRRRARRTCRTVKTSLFFAEPTVAYTAIVRSAGASSARPRSLGLACPIPQLATNAKYTVVIAGTNATGHTCRLFQDFDYGNTPPQYRVHDAASTLGNSVAYGTTNGGTPATFNAANTALLGTARCRERGFTQVQPAGPIPNPTSDSGLRDRHDRPARTSRPQTRSTRSRCSRPVRSPSRTPRGSLNFPSTAGTSVFAIDCTAAAVAALPGRQCNSAPR